uniref:protein-glutamine gamma-glutamyltransferase n=1 Tax=Crocodylus porosus TaxID=8502 RepID=A0A7M4EQ23_CROPO
MINFQEPGLAGGLTWQPSANTSAHRTNRYAHKQLIVRRGQSFTITLYFNRPPQSGDSLAFITETGPSPSEASRTRNVFNLSAAGASGWCASQGPSESNYTNFMLSSPANAPIGRYNLSLQITCGNQVSSRFLGQFVLLFNPWCPGDEVYMDDESERQEYTLNENGIIFVGNAKYIQARGWYYGQFQDRILNICLTMLDLSLYYRQNPVADVTRRGDPKYVGRVLSSMINGNDNDNGVLLGNWQGNFTEYENPSRWEGSVVILHKWLQDNYRPVQYGQCWVFAGVMCTALRCLGIPNRLITNFNSAHDSDRNLSVDKYYDPYGRSLPIGKDSSWDYHVWNEGWFIRTDLGASYNGWQVLDSTPQEPSKGIFQCGPASVVAVKQGDVDLSYDTLFVFSEVNADSNRWIVYSNGTKKRVYCDTEVFGRFISTKAVGSNARVDVTNNYKYPEGSPEERQVYRKAWNKIFGSNTTERRPEVLNERSTDAARNPGISGRFKLVEPPVGQDLSLVLLAGNLAFKHKDLQLSISTRSVLHDGASLPPSWQNTLYIPFRPKEEKVIPWTISYAQDRLVRVSITGEENSTWEKLLVERIITLAYPAILINVLSPVVVNRPFALKVKITIPPHEPARVCVLTMEGSSLLKQQFKPDMGVLRTGQRQLQVNLKRNKFKDIKGHTTLMVAPNIRF